MADIRIKVAKDKASLVKGLLATEDSTGPFQTYADVVAFAASVGLKSGRRLPIQGETSKSEPAPIHRESMSARGHDSLIHLIAVVATNDPKILASDETCDEKRIRLFEEYANAGLEILGGALEGSVNYTETLLIFLSAEREPKDVQEEEFDLSRFMS
jgi:dnd system-associated protein 4